MDTSIETVGSETSETMGTMRSRLSVASEKARATCNRLQEKAVAAAKVTDKTVRDNPYYAMGIAFGAGLLIGFLAMSARKKR
jgi:ElaB/YqjD/DUF883 family membrane-anchored ribosome-binding protein